MKRSIWDGLATCDGTGMTERQRWVIFIAWMLVGTLVGIPIFLLH